MDLAVPAAVMTAPGEVAIEELTLAAPRTGEVLVRLTAAGVCGSDLHVVDGEWARPTPIVLGHEGAGVVEAVGPGVAAGELAVGDHVVLAWVAPCRRCALCVTGRSYLCETSRSGDHVLADGTRRLSRADGAPVYQYLGIGTFAERAVVPASAAVRIPAAVPPEVACLIGCGVATGVGAVVNTAAVRPGQAVCVVGCGGVGLSAVMGAALAGADPIVAVDTEPAKLDLARNVGATHAVHAADGVDVAADVRRIAPGGVDVAIEAIGRPATIELLADLLAPGGTAVMVGMSAQGGRVAIDGYRFPDRGLRLLGSSYGSCVAAVDFPRLAALYLAGRLPLDRLISHRAPLTGLHDALSAMRRRERARTVLLP